MIHFLHKILAFILALVVLFSTLSFKVEKHVCMGEVTDVSYFSKADTCGMVKDDCDIDLKQNSFNKENCCDDINELIPGNHYEQQAIQNFEINQVQFIAIYTYTFFNIFEENITIIPFYNPLPPLIDKDIQIFYQTFLI